MKKLGSVAYLRMAYKMILAYHENFELPQREGNAIDTEKQREAWDAIVEFATTLKDDILGKEK